MRHVILIALFACMSAVPSSPGLAATCQVPSGSYPDIQAALDDPTCTDLVLAAQVFVESPVIDRSLTVGGAGSTQTYIEGQIEVSSGTVVLQGLQISSLPGAATEALWAHSGARVSGLDLVVVNGQTVPLFADGFESGDTSAWSVAVP